MKKNINRPAKNKKKILSVIVIIIFLFYVCLLLNVSNRRYLYIESFFKTISKSINEFFINHAYSTNYFNKNITNSKIKYLEKENDNLKKMLGIKSSNESYVFAKVVNHFSKSWFDKVEIDAGYDDNISNYLPVMNQEGLIGFISKTGKNVSEVKLLTSINEDNLISVSIESEGEMISGMLSDYDDKKNLFKVTDVISKSNVKKGSIVSLSGYDNEAYKGIFVGKVVKEKTENYGLSKTIWVESNVDFNDLMFVFIPFLESK